MNVLEKILEIISIDTNNLKQFIVIIIYINL